MLYDASNDCSYNDDDFQVPYGTPAKEALDIPYDEETEKPQMKVVLVCPSCGNKAIWIVESDTELKYGDEADECDECGYGTEYLYAARSMLPCG